jgi:hypothetical protein
MCQAILVELNEGSPFAKETTIQVNPRVVGSSVG